jgi:hypothetical protein
MIAFTNESTERCAACTGLFKVQDTFLLRDQYGHYAIPDVLREVPLGTRIRLRECKKCARRLWTIELAVKLEEISP